MWLFSWRAAVLVLVLFASTAGAQTNEGCLECHGDEGFATETADGSTRSLFTDQTLFAASVHGEFECTDCHADASNDHPEKLERVDCGTCHDDAASDMAVGVHGDRLRAKSQDAPDCSACHGSHAILPTANPKSIMSKRHQAATCGRCHADAALVKRNRITMRNAIALYEKSFHGKLVAQGRDDAAVCSDCHGTHKMLKAVNRESLVHKANIATTCGSCHENALADYQISAHATALERGIADSPTCVDCHSEHDILHPSDRQAPTSGFNVAVEVCGVCHASERLAAKYDLSPDRVATYRDSYHGLANRGGKAVVANCGSCHGVHDVLPSTDERSRIHANNLAETCGGCHPNANRNFTRGRVHLVEGERETIVMNYLRVIYISFIVVVVAGMVLHNGLDLMARIREARKERRHV